jgi:hypothetical protein
MVSHLLVLTPLDFDLMPKSRRKGLSITWADRVSGETS